MDPTPPADPVLVIGCGYLGSRVAERWRAQGRRVFALTRGRTHELLNLGVEPVVGDVLRPDTLTGLPQVGTALFAIARDRSEERGLREFYVGGLANVLAALPKPKRFIYVSSTGVYGQTQGEEVDESAPTEPREESGRVMLEAEGLLRSRLSGAMILRFAGIYGPNRVIGRWAIEAGEPLTGDPDRWLNLIHVADGARAVLAAEEWGILGWTYNVADDCPVRRRDYYTKLAELVRARPPQFQPPSEGEPPAGANRRILNRRLHGVLGLRLRFPSYLEGLPESL